MTFLPSITLWVSPRKKFLVKKAAIKGTKPMRDRMLSVHPKNSLKGTKLTQDQCGQVHDVHGIVVGPDYASPDLRRRCSGSSDRAKDLEDLRRTEFVAKVFVQVPRHSVTVRVHNRLHRFGTGRKVVAYFQIAVAIALPMAPPILVQRANRAMTVAMSW